MVGKISEDTAVTSVADASVFPVVEIGSPNLNKKATGSQLKSYFLGGGTFTGKITTVASATGNAGFNIPTGTAPTTPTDGDFWVNSGALYVRLNSATYIVSNSFLNGLSGKASPSGVLVGDTDTQTLTNKTLTNPDVTTQTADNNTTKAASTAFVLGQAYTSTPAANGTASAGSSTRWARGDHVHPVPTVASTTPTPTSGAGALTSASSTLNVFKYGAAVSIAGTITLTNVGTASNALKLPLPFTPTVASAIAVQDLTNGVWYVGYVNVADANLYIWGANFTSPHANGRVFYFGGTYFA